MHVKLRDITRPFKQSMDFGTIYFEFSDSYVIAMHRSLYTCEGTNTTENLPYKRFMDLLLADTKVRHLTKMYYKVENLVDAGNNEDVWVDLKLISSNTAGDIYRYAYDYRSYANIQVPINQIKLTRFIDKNYNVFTIDSYDGKIHENETLCNNIKIHTRDKRYIDIKRYSISDPNTSKDYMKDDIRIELKDVETLQYNHDFNNSLFWLNGRFVEPSIDENNPKVAYLVKGIGSVDFHHVGFKGEEPLVLNHTGTNPVASYEPEFDRFVYSPDFDISIFKWEGVNISPWIKPFSFINDKYYYNNNGFSFTVRYSKGVIFPTPITENHMIIHSGVVLNRNDYTIINDTTIILNGIRGKVESIIVSALEEYGEIGTINHIVEKALPKVEDFRLVKFSHNNPLRDLRINRSSLCYKNSPYPFHVTFTDLRVGDIVLLDGLYERYLLHDQNVIRYPYTVYMARYSSRNLLKETNIERIWFNETQI